MTEPTPPPAAAAPAQKSPILSILSLIGGIVGVVLSFLAGAGFLFAVAGVVLGFIARKKEPHGATMALWGIITGFAGIVISIIVIIVVVIVPLMFIGSLGTIGSLGY